MSSSAAARKRPKKAKAAPGRSSPLRSVFREPPSALFPSGEELAKLAAAVAIAAVAAIACHYAAAFFHRLPRPFCDSGRDSSLDPLNDFCESCPENGQCHNGELECAQGYVKHGRTCIEDGVINRTAKKLSDMLQRYICDAYARVLCGQTEKIWFQETDITKIVHEQMSSEIISMKDDGAKFTKLKVMEITESFLETKTDSNGMKEFKCPESLAELHKPLGCRIHQWIRRNIILVATVSILFAGSLGILWTIHRRRVLLKRAEELYQQVCEILEDNAIGAKSAGGEFEPCVVASWLRDHLLLPKERRNTMLWKKVEEFILEDSRIDQYPKMVKGESKTVFEWQVDGSLSSKIKKMRAASKTKLSSHATLPSGYEERNAMFGDQQLS